MSKLLNSKKPKNLAGFTLVEFLIVIVVIAILAAISTIAYNGILDKAETAKLRSDLNSTAKHAEVACLAKFSCPGNVSELNRGAGPQISPGVRLQYTGNGDDFLHHSIFC